LTKVELINGLYKFRDKDKVDKVIDDIFLMLDGDNNGYIEYEEFLRACIDKGTALNNDNLRYAFKFLDKDNSGTLSVDKIMGAFVKKENPTLISIFKHTIKEVDRDKDGLINFDDFKELMLRVQ
jgi:calcium-dependent protein kinase